MRCSKVESRAFRSSISLGGMGDGPEGAAGSFLALVEMNVDGIFTFSSGFDLFCLTLSIDLELMVGCKT